MGDDIDDAREAFLRHLREECGDEAADGDPQSHHSRTQPAKAEMILLRAWPKLTAALVIYGVFRWLVAPWM